MTNSHKVIIAQQSKNNNWISIGSELPKNKTKVLTFDEFMNINALTYDDKWEYFSGAEYPYEVLYWQPLPEPPIIPKGISTTPDSLVVQLSINLHNTLQVKDLLCLAHPVTCKDCPLKSNNYIECIDQAQYLSDEMIYDYINKCTNIDIIDEYYN